MNISKTAKFLYQAQILLVCVGSAFAQIAQEPLLNKPNSVAPNLVLLFDDSGSMLDDSIYQYGNSSNNYPTNSPDVNKIAYDPRVRYLPRVNFEGANLSPTIQSNSVTWNVYFRNSTTIKNAQELINSGDYHNPYTPLASEVVSGSTASYPRTPSSSQSTYPKFLKRNDCVTNATSCTWLEERTNYSIWKQWYSTRARMSQTGIGAAFQSIKTDTLRLGYGTINGVSDNSRLAKGVGLYNDTDTAKVKSSFYTWLYGLSFPGDTPNLGAVDKAGKYYQRTDSDGPWATLPNPSSTEITNVIASGPGKSELSTNHASCRRSYTMLVTDGYWNSTRPSTAGNYDNTDFTIYPDIGAPFEYRASYPYKDSASNTMADLAMFYWGKDLRPDLRNRVPPINSFGTKNESSWQNVSFYAVTLGIDGTLPRSTAAIEQETYRKLSTGELLWPSPSANSQTTIDDTWHATINGRGDMLNANNATELTAGMNNMFVSIAGTPQTLSGVAVSTTYLKNGTRKYKPQYIPGTWTGKLSAIELDATTGNEKSGVAPFWEVEKGLNALGDPISTIPLPSARNIATWSGAAGVVFNSTNTGLSVDLVNYLRGDSSKEIRKSTGTFRNREAKLGDIINSTPVYIQDNLNMGYEKLLPAGSFGNYPAFYAQKAARSDGVLFVGANDGMLHGFRNSDGVETFAYVPKAVVPNLYKLSEANYIHQYFVDGPNIETDAYLDGAWKNILIGTTGAGAKAVFALDVTDPLAMSASKVMWEVNSGSTGFSELGHVMSDVQAGITENGDWVAIFGNGYGSAGGLAQLFVANLKTGALMKLISTGVGSNNGLSGVRVVRNADMRIIGAYGGDLKGNLWKFDLMGTPSNWKVGLGGNAVYSAGATKPITATPAVLEHPDGGYVVTFGTGKFFETTDATTTTTQNLFGIWDKTAFGSASIGTTLTGTNNLVKQTITKVTTGDPPIDFFKISNEPVSWGDGTSGIRGWYIDLPNSGERSTYPMERLSASGTFLLVSTISPFSEVSADACIQTGSGSGWAYILDGLTGSGPTLKILDTNADGAISAGDQLVSGWRDAVDGRPTAITMSSTSKKDNYCIVTAQSSCTKTELACGQAGAKACPAAALSGVKARQWRQIYLR